MNVAVSTKKCSLLNHGGVTKSHCCDSQTVANDFIGNTVVTLGGKCQFMSCDNNFKSQEHLKNLAEVSVLVCLIQR